MNKILYLNLLAQSITMLGVWSNTFINYNKKKYTKK